MEFVQFEDLVVRALSSNKCVSAFIQCEIVYSGRAETYLGRGDRLLIIKADQSIIIHQPEGSMPVNYMKAGTEVKISKDKHHLSIQLFNHKEKAWLDITIHRVYDAQAHKMDDGQKIDLAGNEKDMSDHIRDNPNLLGDDFQPISREQQTDVGFIDVFGHDKEGSLIVVECKRITASLQAVDQLRRYVERVKEIKGTDNVKGIIAAPAITPNAKHMLKSWGYKFCSVEPPKRLERWLKDQKSLGDF